eukprot:TRINITY_DN60840_c0_g1_i3.p1 TRINITY_DN60840_c0_g1~~TRINITY_DN60840_c0_g1_i3.p1  ORF type:complete len:203 (+),score=10.14 TRINITY_DN60840_c0_g1_i3:29-637(+)
MAFSEWPRLRTLLLCVSSAPSFLCDSPHQAVTQQASHSYAQSVRLGIFRNRRDVFGTGGLCSTCLQSSASQDQLAVFDSCGRWGGGSCSNLSQNLDNGSGVQLGVADGTCEVCLCSDGHLVPSCDDISNLDTSFIGSTSWGDVHDAETDIIAHGFFNFDNFNSQTGCMADPAKTGAPDKSLPTDGSALMTWLGRISSILMSS